MIGCYKISEVISTESLDKPGTLDVLVNLISRNWILYSLDGAKRDVSGRVEACRGLVQDLPGSPRLHVINLG